jgi:phage I-like protein
MTTPTLRAQFTHRLLADGAKWNLLFPRGKWHGANLAAIGGSIDLDSGLLDEMVANWQAAGAPRLPIRITHRHLDDDVPATERIELEKAVGFLVDLRVTADGLEALTEWNAAGKQLVDAGAYAFWSPEWQPRHRDRRTGDVKGWWLSGTALTNDPFFNEMPPVAAANPTEPNPQHQEQPMNEEQKKLRASLGLAENATDAEVLAAQTKRNAELTTLTAEVTKLKSLDVKALVAEAVKAATEPMQAQLKAAEEKALSLEIDQLIATAKAGDGKNGRAIADTVKPVLLKLVATEAKREDGIKAAKDYLEAIPLTVPVIATGTTGSTEPLTASAAGEKLKAEAEKLQKDGNITPWLSAVARNPELARIAQEGK